jgi:acylglycerol lipase
MILEEYSDDIGERSALQAGISGLNLTGSAGQRLHITCWECPTVMGILLMIPGKNDHGGRYEELAEQVSALGWCVWGLDLRGQGRSAGPIAQVNRFQEFLEDVDVAVQAIRARYPHQPIVLAGYSMGAAVAVEYCVEHPKKVSGFIGVSPCFCIENRLTWWMPPTLRVLDWLLPHYVLSRSYNPLAVTRDLEQQRRIASDPYMDGTTRPRLIMELRRAAKRCLNVANQMTLPVLTLVSPSDRIVDPTAVEAFHRDLPGNATLCRYPGLRHDLLHEEGREAVFEDICRWLSLVWPNA